jgi:hypothetical protein
MSLSSEMEQARAEMEQADSIDFDCLTSSDAKKEYFLTTEDLNDGVPYQSMPPMFASGRPTRFYSPSDLRAAAVLKHGEDGYAKKCATREKRLTNKRKKEEAALEAES